MTDISVTPLLIPTSLQASVELIQGKSGTELTQKFDRASMMVVEIYGTTDFCA